MPRWPFRSKLPALPVVAIRRLLHWGSGAPSHRQIIPEHTNPTPLPDAGSTPPGDPGTAQPITRPRDRDAQLRRSSDFLEFAQAAGGFGVFDLNLVTGEINGTSLFFELIGQQSRELTLTREEWLASIHPQDLESVVHALNLAIETGVRYEAEYRSLLLDGGIRWLAGRGQVLKDAEGYPSRAIGTITDITDRKELEEKLRHTTESLNIAQATPTISTLCSESRLPYPAQLERPPHARAPRRPGARLPRPLRDHPRGALLSLRIPPGARGGTGTLDRGKGDVSRSKAGEVNRITGAIVDITD